MLEYRIRSVGLKGRSPMTIFCCHNRRDRTPRIPSTHTLKYWENQWHIPVYYEIPFAVKDKIVSPCSVVYKILAAPQIFQARLRFGLFWWRAIVDRLYRLASRELDKGSPQPLHQQLWFIVTQQLEIRPLSYAVTVSTPVFFSRTCLSIDYRWLHMLCSVGDYLIFAS